MIVGHWCFTDVTPFLFIAAQPDHDPNTKHCLCGADGELSPLFTCLFFFNFNLNDFMPQRLFHNQWCHYSYWTYICPLIISADLLMLGKMVFFLIFFFCLITIHMQIHVIDWCSKKVFKFKHILRIYNVQFINIPQCLYL